MGTGTGITVDDVRSAASELAAALDASGATAAAGVLADALRIQSVGRPEELMELRSALVRTRAEWEDLHDVDLVAHARMVLAAAKRLAIEQ